ncbi:hypothetical protein [Chromobacterium sp. IIBBL 290-4]|uniref:hypothetical protein n=1 Tax=Chromobacterium sp. IIBBL 290-4 TaxID=2953890 RepID=UPI0020B79698|nr:hypothetical protein [Chromobacterium sp. IIBBL 290-4]UTH75180.1 hypothetical protein NKT35_03520 [Chromobacterium sp. IIBBL 290-4]
MTNTASAAGSHAPQRVDVFLQASCKLLEFSLYQLQGTGVAATLCEFCRDYVGPERFDGWMEQLLELPSEPLAKEQAMFKLLNDDFYGPITRNLQMVWYLGSWLQLPESWQQRYAPDKPNTSVVVSSQTYQQGLVWPLLDAHPPGAKQQGWAVWSRPPLPAALG